MLAKPWHISLLGTLEARSADSSISHFRTQKAGAILACLAFYPHRAQPREELVAQLWPGDDLAAGRNGLRVSLSSLRHQLEPEGSAPNSVLIADRASIRLDPAAFTTDVAEFESLLERASRAENEEEQILMLARGVDLYHGELLPGYYEDWILMERERLAQSYLSALRRLTRLMFKKRDLERATDYALRALNADPSREEAHCDLIRLYAALGQTAKALKQYEELERALQQIDAQPSAAVRQYVASLRQGDSGSPAAGQAAAAPDAPKPPAGLSPQPHGGKSAPAVRGALPILLTRFFGRERECARLGALLTSSLDAVDTLSPLRLVTITGPGGAGKTRMAVETARRVQARFPGGAWFVPLADFHDPRLIPEAVAGALQLARRLDMDALEQVAQALRAGPALLVLDNYEHLAPDGALQTLDLLERIPDLTCLVTSRRLLGLPGEAEFPLPLLPVPEDGVSPERLAENECVQLFVNRALSARPDFLVTPANAPAITAVCRRLDGLPLALELAAARIRVLTPRQIYDQLDARLDLLSDPRADKDFRHRSLRATVAWSYALLAPALRRFFAGLSVFAGGWSLEAARAVSGRTDALDLLDQLRADSLVVTEERNDEVRFHMLETLRHYAAEQVDLRAREALAQRHAEYYTTLAELAKSRLDGSDAADWLLKLELEQENLRAVLDWCRLEPERVPLGLRLAAALQRFWLSRGHLREGGERYEELLALPGGAERTATRAEALRGAGVLMVYRGDADRSRSLYEQSLEIRRELGDPAHIMPVLRGLAHIDTEESRFDSATARLEECLAIARAIGDRSGEAAAMDRMGMVAYYRRDYEAAQVRFEESLTRRNQAGDLTGIADSLNLLGMVSAERGDTESACALYEQSLALARRLGEKPKIAVAVINLGESASQSGDHDKALCLLREGLRLVWEMGDNYLIVRVLELCGHCYARDRRPERAARLFGALSHHSRDQVSPNEARYREEHDRALAAVRAELDSASYAIAWAEGRAMTLPQVVASTLEE